MTDELADRGSGEARPATLSRALGFWALTFYGVGDILGAGIYALVGKVAGGAGGWSPLSFLIAMMVAGLTGLTYAELVARYPRSGGEATFCLEAFARPRLALFVGWLVFCSGAVSMATVAHGVAGYAHAIWPAFPRQAIWVVFLAAISLINFWGIRQSSMMNVLFTLVEAGGLMLVIVVGVLFLSENGVPPQVVAQEARIEGLGVFSAAALAFFAYIGFEDMIKVAEEVRRPSRTYPKAIIAAVIVCGGIYIAVASVAVAIVPAAELGAAQAPLLIVVRRAAPAVPPLLFTLIALIAVANTGLLNCIMASRLIYGMAQQRLLPGWLGAVHARTQTPHRAVLAIFLVTVALAFSGTLAQLAETTSLLLLIVFAIVNGAAIRLRMTRNVPVEGFHVPLAVPISGLLTCVGLAAFVAPKALATGAIVLAIGLLPTLLSPGAKYKQ